MAETLVVHTRIDGAIKEEAASVLAAIGLTVSDAVRLLLTRVAREKALPFEPWVPNAVTLQVMRDAREGRNMTPVTLDDLRAIAQAEAKRADD